MTTLDDVRAAIQQKWGHNALKPARHLEQTTSIVSGVAVLDALTGGLLRGKSTAFTGAPTSGKTTTAYRWIAVAQQSGEEVVYVDVRGIFDPGYATACGIDAERTLLTRPPHLLDGLEMVREIAASGVIGLIVLDTVSVDMPLQRLRLQNTALLILASEPVASADMQLHFELKRLLRRVKRAIGYEVEVQLTKHPTLAPNKIIHQVFFPETAV